MVWTVRVVVVCTDELPVNDGMPSGAPETLAGDEEGGWAGAGVHPDGGAVNGSGSGGGGDVVTARDDEVGLSKSTENGVFTPGEEPLDPDRSGTIARLRRPGCGSVSTVTSKLIFVPSEETVPGARSDVQSYAGAVSDG